MSEPLLYREIQFSRLGGTLPEKVGSFVAGIPTEALEEYPVLGVLIHKADAIEALRLVLSELRIRADERFLDFPTDNIIQATFCAALEKLTGGDFGVENRDANL